MSKIKMTPDRTLIDPNFNGYKLSNSSDVVTSYSKDLPEGLYEVSKAGETPGYLSTYYLSLHNHLTPDPPTDANEPRSVYCFNSRGQLMSFDYVPDLLFCDGRVVWQTDLSKESPIYPLTLLIDCSQEEKEEKCDTCALPPSLVFADTSVAVACDGRSKLFVILTADRNPEQHHTWETKYATTVGASKVLDARIVPSTSNEDSSFNLHILLASVASVPSIPVALPSHLKTLHSINIVTWLTLSSQDGNEYTPARERLYACSSTLEYCQFDREGESLIALTHRHCCLLHDSARPEISAETENPAKTESESSPRYIYRQNDDEITVSLSTGVETSSEDLRICVSSSHLAISQSNGTELLKVAFAHSVEPSTATWNIEGGSVEVCVSKTETGKRWENLFRDSELKGEEVPDEQEMNELKDKLSHLTSDSWNKGGLGDKPAYNANQQEECDDAEEDLLLLRIEAETKCNIDTMPKRLLGNVQYLGTIPNSCGLPSHFCLRQDVDGFVWRVEPKSGDNLEPFCHAATFNAFGYVKASKTMAKFTSAPTDFSYVAVSDVRSHVFVFCQPVAAAGRELKNRKTGKISSKVARQLLLSVPSPEEVMGLATYPGLVVVCTKKKLFAFCLRLEEA